MEENEIVEEVIVNQEDGITKNTVTMLKDFFLRLKERVKPEELPDVNILKQSFSSSILNSGQISSVLNNAVKNNVILKEIKIESKLDIPTTIKQMQRNYDMEVNRIVEHLTMKYQSLIDKLELTFRQAMVGEKLLSLLNVISNAGWHLILKPNSVNAVYVYETPHPVTVGMRTDINEKWIYERAICKLQAIYFNIMHPKVTNSTIHLNTTDGRHPNATGNYFTSVCTGDLSDENIPVDDPVMLLNLLLRVKKMYEEAHLESAFYKPDSIPYRVEPITVRNSWDSRVR